MIKVQVGQYIEFCRSFIDLDPDARDAVVKFFGVLNASLKDTGVSKKAAKKITAAAVKKAGTRGHPRDWSKQDLLIKARTDLSENELAALAKEKGIQLTVNQIKYRKLKLGLTKRSKKHEPYMQKKTPLIPAEEGDYSG